VLPTLENHVRRLLRVVPVPVPVPVLKLALVLNELFESLLTSWVVERVVGTPSKGGPVSAASSSVECERAKGDDSGSVKIVAGTEPSKTGADAVNPGVVSETLGAGRSCRDASSQMPPR
jgi:hypothetical protein